MTIDFAALFELYAEPVAAICSGELIYRNQAAVKCFSEEKLWGIIRACEGAAAPSVCAVWGCDVMVSEFQGCRIYRVISNAAADTSGVFIKNAGNYLKNAMSNFQLASKYVVNRMEHTADSKLEKYMALMNHSFYTVSYLTEEISRLSDGLSGNMHIEKEMFDAEELLSKLVHSVSIYAKGKAELIFENRASNVIISGDKVRLELSVLALISNSLKYTPNSGKIKVILDKREKNVFITVSDTGCGMSADKLTAAFRKYEQNKEVPEPTDGLGVGLAYARFVAEKHDGRIMLDSRKNIGTNVTICVPEGIDDKLILKSPRVEYCTSGGGTLLRELSMVLDVDCYTPKFLD